MPAPGWSRRVSGGWNLHLLIFATPPWAGKPLQPVAATGRQAQSARVVVFLRAFIV